MGSGSLSVLKLGISLHFAIPSSRGSSPPRDRTRSPPLQADSLPSELPGKLQKPSSNNKTEQGPPAQRKRPPRSGQVLKQRPREKTAQSGVVAPTSPYPNQRFHWPWNVTGPRAPGVEPLSGPAVLGAVTACV